MNASDPVTAPKPLDESRFAVPGMSCAGCIAKIETGLGKIDGVHVARVNFTSKQVTVAHESHIKENDLAEAIGAIGFEAAPIGAADGVEKALSRKLIRSMGVAGFAAMNVMLLSVSVWAGAEGTTRNLFHWLSALIAIPAIAYAGRPFFESAFGALRHGRTNMDVPISIGVTIAAGMSLYETAVGGEHAWFEGALMLLFFLLAGRVLDQAMQHRVRDGVAALAKQTSSGALVVTADGTSQWRDASELRPGMQILVAAGERLAADGIVVSGLSSLDCALLTGEGAPRSIEPGSEVFAGTLNLHAPVLVEVTKASDQTALAEILLLMENAGQTRSRYVRIADRAARLYAPVVHTLALAAFAGWLLAGAGWHEALLIAVAVLIITCPCALGLAVPVAHVVSTGTLMRQGILVKQGSALERLAQADYALFDKTGTLTMGRPIAQGLDRLDEQQRAIALGLAQASRHPLSSAIRLELEKTGTRAARIEHCDERPGYGVFGLYEGKRVSLVRPSTHRTAQAVELQIEGQASAIVAFTDELRPNTREAIASLRLYGLACSIASGDKAGSVEALSEELDLPAQSGVTPGGKFDAIEQLAQQGHKVLMIGDGLNDGPALNAAHVSMAPASASDVGQNAADIVFLGDSFAPVPTALRMARRTMRVVRQNFTLAIAYNLIAIPLAIAGFVTPLIAAAAMSASSIVVVANSLRLRRAP